MVHSYKLTQIPPLPSDLFWDSGLIRIKIIPYSLPAFLCPVCPAKLLNNPSLCFFWTHRMINIIRRSSSFRPLMTKCFIFTLLNQSVMFQHVLRAIITNSARCPHLRTITSRYALWLSLQVMLECLYAAIIQSFLFFPFADAA